MTSRWDGIKRPYSTADVRILQTTVVEKHIRAENAANKLWKLLRGQQKTAALGALTGNQAMQQVRAGLEAIYVSGWQVAADANLARTMYPDQSLYPSNSVPALVQQINNTLQRADQVCKLNNNADTDWDVPIVADAEAGFGGQLNAFELMKAMIEAGAAGVHFEDQLASEKKCGHLGGKVLVPTKQFIKTLIAARLAADVLEVSTILIARTDADSAKLLTSDIDERDKEFIDRTEMRTPEGYFKLKGTGMERCVARGLAYAPYADVLWMETSNPSLKQAQEFADAIHEKYPNKILAYNCSPSFNWSKYLSDEELQEFQLKLNEMGYKFQFVTLAGWHALNYGMFELAFDYKNSGMLAYAALQNQEFQAESRGYTAVKHQQEVGTGYFDKVAKIISGGDASTMALAGSTEEEQF